VLEEVELLAAGKVKGRECEKRCGTRSRHDCVSCTARIPRLAAFSVTQMPTSAMNVGGLAPLKAGNRGIAEPKTAPAT
jgi:hypothetical protein